jgi:hypothetical protein
MRTWNPAAIPLLIGLTFMPCRAAQPTRVENGPLPSQTIRNWHLKEEWRTGSGEKDPLFGFIVDVDRDPAGNTFRLRP